MCSEDGLPPQGPTRKDKMWFVVPYMDCSGVEIFSTEKQAREVAILLANRVRGEVWVYGGAAQDKAIPTEAQIQAFCEGE